jgi:single stranded DNA-binding protein
MINLNGWATIASDLELKSVGANGASVCRFSVAMNETIGKNDDGTYKEITSFFRCELWDSGAEYLVNNAHKGDGITFSGTPRQEKWVDKDTGDNRESIYFRVNKFRIIPKKVRAE